MTTRKPRDTLRTHVDLGMAGEVEVEVDYDYIPGDPGCHTMRNGDPGWPPTAPEIQICCITTVSGVDITKLMKGKTEAIEDEITQREAERKYEALEDRADAENDERLLRQWQESQEARCDD